jgi:hypothetical protein
LIVPVSQIKLRNAAPIRWGIGVFCNLEYLASYQSVSFFMTKKIQRPIVICHPAGGYPVNGSPLDNCGVGGNQVDDLGQRQNL